jgi:hypothetical protein
MTGAALLVISFLVMGLPRSVVAYVSRTLDQLQSRVAPASPHAVSEAARWGRVVGESRCRNDRIYQHLFDIDRNYLDRLVLQIRW